MIKKISVDRLSKGMYVCGNNRKWLETPFFRTKFLLKTAQQLDDLQKYCTFVFIDTEKGIDVSVPDLSEYASEDQMSKEQINAAIYPEGSIVELNNGQLAVIVKNNANAQLKPEILLVTDTNKNMLPDTKHLNMDDANIQLAILDKLHADDPLLGFMKLYLNPVTK